MMVTFEQSQKTWMRDLFHQFCSGRELLLELLDMHQLSFHRLVSGKDQRPILRWCSNRFESIPWVLVQLWDAWLWASREWFLWTEGDCGGGHHLTRRRLDIRRRNWFWARVLMEESRLINPHSRRSTRVDLIVFHHYLWFWRLMKSAVENTGGKWILYRQTLISTCLFSPHHDGPWSRHHIITSLQLKSDSPQISRLWWMLDGLYPSQSVDVSTIWLDSLLCIRKYLLNTILPRPHQAWLFCGTRTTAQIDYRWNIMLLSKVYFSEGKASRLSNSYWAGVIKAVHEAKICFKREKAQSFNCMRSKKATCISECLKKCNHHPKNGPVYPRSSLIVCWQPYLFHRHERKKQHQSFGYHGHI